MARVTIARGDMKKIAEAAMTVASSVISGLLAFVVLAVATRQGQFMSIAGYGVGAGSSALIAAVASGGTTLVYTTGQVTKQALVRTFRLYVIVPIMVLGAIATTLWASWTGQEVGALDVAAGSLAVCFTNYTEIDVAWHRRELLGGRMLCIEAFSRLASVISIFIGAHFAIAMAVGAALRTAMYSFSARTDASVSDRSLSLLRGWRDVFAKNITALTYFYAINDKVPLIVSPLAAGGTLGGKFSSIVNVEQSVSGVGMSGIQTTLAVRSKHGIIPRWSKILVAIVICGSILVSLAALVFGKSIASWLGIGYGNAIRFYWICLTLTLPLSVMSRAVDFRLLASDDTRSPAFGRGLQTIVILIGSALSIHQGGLVGLSTAVPLGEFVALLTGGIKLTIALRRERLSASER